MNRVLPIYWASFILSIFTVINVAAQDIHYSMFYHAPQIMNPGLTGIFNGDVRVMGHYRNQWKDVPVDYTTFSGTYDMKYYPRKKPGNDFWGFGVNFNYDKAGLSKLSLAELQLGGSYTTELSKNTFLTGGAQIGLASRRFKEDDLTFDNQYNGSQFDPALPTGEDFDNTSIFYIDFAIGANLRLQNDNQRTKLDLGVSVDHLNRPRQEFFDDSDIKLPNRIALYGIGAIKLANPLDLMLHGSAQFQNQYQEYLPGAALRLYLNQNRGKELAFQAGVNARFTNNDNDATDAIIPTIELHIKTFRLGISYDINVSDFEIATDNQGGPEIWVSYRIVKVKPLSRFKTCPIF